MPTDQKLLAECKEKWPISKITKRPWKANTLMIVDADGSIIMHLGGMRLDDRMAEPCFLTSLADYIVNAVNAYEEES